jgi:hypothetical protein
MSNEILDGERGFFVTGVNTYLEVDDAMSEFRRLVQHKCRTAASQRLDELNQACGMHWTVNDLNDYFEANTNNHHIGKQVELKGLGGLYFCLRLSRIDKSRPLAAFVFLYRLRRDLAADLWGQASGSVLGKNHLNFAQPFPEDKVLDFEGYLDRAVTDFLAFIKGSGGLQKYLGS